MDNDDITFVYTLTAQNGLHIIASFLRRLEVKPRPVIAALLEQYESTVGAFPYGCQICPELLKLGCAQYREFNSQDGYRILYAVDENVLTAHAIVAQRQDIKQLLFNRLILA